jgi:glycosyltransferase involved in cell wall biosynthesis
MIRVTILRSAEADYQTESGVAALSRGSDAVATTICRIGAGGEYFNPLVATLSLRRGISPDVIHAWGQRALTAAVLGSSRPVIYSPTEFPTMSAIRWVRAILSYRRIDVVCPTDTMRRAFVERGVPIERCHLIRPGVDFSRVKSRRNSELRAALGFSADDFVMLPAGDSLRSANHRDAIWTAALLHVLDPKNMLLLWGRGPQAQRMHDLTGKLDQQQMMNVAEDRLGRRVDYEEILAAVDCVLVSATKPAPILPVATAMAAGLPIVAVVTETISELLEDRHTAMFVQSRLPRQIAQRVLDLKKDSQLQWSITDMARTEAYEYFSLTRCLQQWRAVYEQVAEGKPVEVPQSAPGAGLRFHGRA